VKELDITFKEVLNGALGVGHRPKLKSLKTIKDQGVTHIWTLLSEREGALDIKSAVHGAGLEWIWLPLPNGKPPDKDKTSEILDCFRNTKAVLTDGAKIYLHCSAGIHRTGLISYAFLRYLGFSGSDSLEKITSMRRLTGEGVGEDRLNWGDVNFS